MASPYDAHGRTSQGTRPSLGLLDVLSQLAICAVDRILCSGVPRQWAGARLACKELRDFVDSNIGSARLDLCWETAAVQPEVRKASPLARFKRCSSLTVRLLPAGWDPEGSPLVELYENAPHPALLAALCVAGVGADVAGGIRELCLVGLDLPTISSAALVLGGVLRGVRKLELDTFPRCAGGFEDMHAIHTSLRLAFPALEELCLPGKCCLRGLEAFAGSALHTVGASTADPGPLRLCHARSLCALPGLRHLDLLCSFSESPNCMDDDDDDDEYDVEEQWDMGGSAADEVLLAREAELPPGDQGDEEALGGLKPEHLATVLALRWLLASAPPALENMRLGEGLREVRLAGGRLASVDIRTETLYSFGIAQVAAALLPRLVSTGQRLPLLKVSTLTGTPDCVTQLLQPHTPLARLLAWTDRVELGELELGARDGYTTAAPQSAADVAAPLQAVVRAIGGLPARLRVRGATGWGCDLRLRVQQEGQRGVIAAHGGSVRGRYAAGRAAASAGAGPHASSTAAPALPALVVEEVTAADVLERAAAHMWAEAAAEGLVARAEEAEARRLAATRLAATAAAPPAAGNARARPMPATGVKMHLLLRGPFVRQLTCGPGAGVGAGLLLSWLDSLMQPPPPPAGQQGTAAAGGAAAGSATAAVAGVWTRHAGCQVARCGPGTATAVVQLVRGPLAALRLARAATAAAGQVPGCLEVSAVRENVGWSEFIMRVLQALWDGRQRHPAASGVAAAMAAAAPGNGQVQGDGAGRPCAPHTAPSAGQAGAELGRAQGELLAAGALEGVEADLELLQRLLLLAEQSHQGVEQKRVGSTW
ncbi:hypothetical protein HYH02_012226 [Chlamydomonas schloesseri]|uniref:Uncharacterized protein n=1 Tax=Chlamydomonas schloesseri TaxID=2026947 RepID=A0A835W0C1_9CHLO|nr:hypothetical protein HYH02_012226 [Chlamydomonas schloesseri]|eukprot:KAG2434560.1 hypothetical protein HYH02_012226 [Chlamydomonas schloesseri]